MKNLTKLVLGTVSLLGLGISTAAFADDAPASTGIFGADYPLSAYVAVQSDYRFRGISQNGKDPSPEASLNLGAPDGFYAGLWAAKVDWTDFNQPSYELDEYAGKHTDLWGTDLNTEAYYYSYPDAENYAKFVAGNHKASYLEGIAQLTHVFGPLTLMATYAYSPEFSGGTGTGNYLEGTATFAVNDWLSISGNFGHQWVQGAKGYLLSTYGVHTDGDYSHFDIGATATYKSLSLDARYVGTDMNAQTCSFYMVAQANHPCSGGFVATLTYNVASFPW